MRSTILFGAACTAAVALALAGPSAPVRAEMIELEGGGILQGDILPGQTTDDGVALSLYETGGVVVVKWKHVLESRRKALRRELGIDIEEQTEALVEGHVVTLTDGTTVVGVAENPRTSGEKLRLRTRQGVKEYDRSVIARIDSARIPALQVFSPEELYQDRMDKERPEVAAQHMDVGRFCMTIGLWDKANEHLNAAKSDAEFMKTTQGRAVDGMLQQVEVMIRAKGAQDLVTQIKQAKYANTAAKWNEALRLLRQLEEDERYKDEAIRKAISFDTLSNTVVKGRDKFFRQQVQMAVYSSMERMIEAKARERKPATPPANLPRGAAMTGTLAAARQWLGRELGKALWEKVASDLGLDEKADEVTTYWKDRSGRNSRRASYGTGSFIVVKKAAPAPGAGNEPRQRRPPGSDRDRGSSGKNVPAKAAQPVKPKTEEEWWESVDSRSRAQWLIASYVESSGLFEVIRTDEMPCDHCGGKGFMTFIGSDGGESQTYCVQCNGAGKERRVTYR